jgi:hypothetical protein
LAAAVVLFIWFADRGRGPEAVMVAVPNVATEATGPNDTVEPSEQHAAAPPEETVEAAGDEWPDELDALTTAAGKSDETESVPSDRASSAADGDIENLDASSQDADTRSEEEPGQPSDTVEQPVEEATAPPPTVPRHGQLAWFEIGVITRSSNLRERPDVESAIVARLRPGTRVRVLEETPVFGYYRVLSDGREGWLWWLNVKPGLPVEGRG